MPSLSMGVPSDKRVSAADLSHIIPGACRSLLGVGWTAGATSGALLGGWVSGDRDLFCRATVGWARKLSQWWKLDVRVTGREHLPPGPCVFVANHQSYVDIVALFVALPRYPHFVAKSELGRIPFLGQALRAGHHILIRRSGGKKAKESLVQAAERVRAGSSILIFPEGTRSSMGEVGEFRKGGFRLAKLAGVPIVPVAVCGTGRVLPRGSLLVRRARVEVHIGAPFHTNDVTSASCRDLAVRVRRQVIHLGEFKEALHR